jgi:uncharacterized protein (DUF697 family)
MNSNKLEPLQFSPLIEDNKRQTEAAWLIHACALANGSVAFGLANTLAGDTALITSVSLYMIYRLGRLYEVDDVNGKQIITQIITHYAGPLIGAKLLFWLPGIGNWANAASMSLLTELIGWSCIILFSQGRSTDQLEKSDWKKLLSAAKQLAKDHQKANKVMLEAMTEQEKTQFASLNEQLANKNLTALEKDRIFQSLMDLYATVAQRTKME